MTAIPPVYLDPERLPPRPELPDPLFCLDGTPVESAADWNHRRRPELAALFSHYVYGWAPPPPPIEATVTRTDDTLLGGRATLKEIEIRFAGLPTDAPRIRLALFLPHGRPAPVFLGLNDLGNQAITDHPAISVDSAAWVPPEKSKDVRRGAQTDFWCLEYLISRGWGLATFHQSDIDPDRDDFSDGIHPFYTDMPHAAPSRWGTIAAWAWGLSRCVDYLVGDPAVKSDAIGVIGHSRRGKTALLAGALDQRFAVVVPHQSGTGGCALSRGNDQETVERINRVFPHWFNDVFPRFAGCENLLPVDQHLLMAMVAPRPLLDTAGLRDEWANFSSAFRALQAADPVYQLLGAAGLAGTGQVAQDEALDGCGALLQYRRDTDHTLDQGYWRAILDFADMHLGTAIS
jgi:hypothetical protein